MSSARTSGSFLLGMDKTTVMLTSGWETLVKESEKNLMASLQICSSSIIDVMAECFLSGLAFCQILSNYKSLKVAMVVTSSSIIASLDPDAIEDDALYTFSLSLQMGHVCSGGVRMSSSSSVSNIDVQRASDPPGLLLSPDSDVLVRFVLETSLGIGAHYGCANNISHALMCGKDVLYRSWYVSKVLSKTSSSLALLCRVRATELCISANLLTFAFKSQYLEEMVSTLR
ncbi:unnamed protein product [Cuscuta campestris]|uniref:Uncharacterized protein n=1 Tax=Cuscuta campestris TaxID=132261 RepID=A0A484NCP0_9ASTE|nr:unnamed protein product [Cuscuta campestris]